MKTKRIELKDIKTQSLESRPSKVSIGDFGKTYSKGSSLLTFLDNLPNILSARELRELTSQVASAFNTGKTVILGLGAHVIKVGLNPLVIDLMKRKLVSAIAMNGAGIIHDAEIAMTGATSENVDETLGGGTFGMTRETAEGLNRAISEGSKSGLGLGESVGRWLMREDFPHKDLSILAMSVRLGIPVTVHVAIGTDVIHIHPSMDGAATGAASYLDFRTLCSFVASLEGGVYMNIGSAVILPEVFLKALTLVRNLNHKVEHFITANMDFITQYRPSKNVVERPTKMGGRGYNFIGHHEILFPLFAAALIEQIEKA
jgi:hypothetical protein